MSPRISALLITAAVAVPALIVAQQSTERVDLNVLHRIKVAEFGSGGGGGRGRGGAQGGR
ncbi:MAG: hypothetical protein EBY17_15950 [Acidobacteriia bacterium]|nr:hypothetical protein [Terriglobia bacterium]